ncbi:aminotransferase class IV [Agrobacterium pusense]
MANRDCPTIFSNEMTGTRTMGRTVFVNGQWLDETAATISIFDRGFLFADAIYEVTAVADGKLIDFKGHTDRLKRSLETLGIPMPVAEGELLALHQEIARRNGITHGLVYLQISRGAEDRNFIYTDGLRPTIVMFTQPRTILANPGWERGITMKTAPDGRWAHRQIKTVQLLYSSMAKMEALREGYDDVLFVEDGLITESGSANFHIITKDGILITRDLSNALLHGITRASVLDLGARAGLETRQAAVTLEEAKNAEEAFITDSISFVMPVVSIDGHPVGLGKPGPATAKLRKLYIEDRLATGINIAERAA